MNSDMKVENIFQELKEVANSDDAVHMKVYMKNQFEFLGVKTPIRRQISKIVFKKNHNFPIDWDFINQAWENPYREMQYVVLDYLQLKQTSLASNDLTPITSKRANGCSVAGANPSQQSRSDGIFYQQSHWLGAT